MPQHGSTHPPPSDSPGPALPPGPGTLFFARVAVRHLCPDCASPLDAWRLNPATGITGRKCAACQSWHRR